MHSTTIGRMGRNERDVDDRIQSVLSTADEAQERITELEAQNNTLQEKIRRMEGRFKSLDDWAGDIAERTDPVALWFELSEKDKKIKELEARVEELESSGVSGLVPVLRETSKLWSSRQWKLP